MKVQTKIYGSVEAIRRIWIVCLQSLLLSYSGSVRANPEYDETFSIFLSVDENRISAFDPIYVQLRIFNNSEKEIRLVRELSSRNHTVIYELKGPSDLRWRVIPVGFGASSRGESDEPQSETMLPRRVYTCHDDVAQVSRTRDSLILGVCGSPS